MKLLQEFWDVRSRKDISQAEGDGNELVGHKEWRLSAGIHSLGNATHQ